IDYVNDSGTNSSPGLGWFDAALAVSPTNPAFVYAGGVIGILSTDSGTDWSETPQFTGTYFGYPDIHALAFDASGNLLIGSDTGIGTLRAGDTNGMHATHINGTGNNALYTILFYSTAVDPSEINNAMGASQDNGIARFNGNLNWSYSSIN